MSFFFKEENGQTRFSNAKPDISSVLVPTLAG
jgi:hypothetical protein